MNSARQVRARLLGDPADDFRLTRRTAGRIAWLGWAGPLFFMLVGKACMRFWHVAWIWRRSADSPPGGACRAPPAQDNERPSGGRLAGSPLRRL